LLDHLEVILNVEIGEESDKEITRFDYSVRSRYPTPGSVMM